MGGMQGNSWQECRETTVYALGMVLDDFFFFSLKITLEIIQRSAMSHVSCFNYSVCEFNFSSSYL